jgi:hypothetical protein
MTIELKVIGDDAEAIAKDIIYLAGAFGVVAGRVRFERTGQDTIIGTAIGRPLKRPW